MAGQGDPGWGHALRTGWRDLLVPFRSTARREADRHDALTALRIVFLASAAANVLVAVITRFVSAGGSNDDPSMSPAVFLVLIGAVGVLDVVLLSAWALPRTPPQAAEAGDVTDWFRSVTLLGYSLATAPFLIGFVGVFVTNEWTMVLAGLPFAAVVYWLVAPTKRRLASAQRQLERAGIAVDLVDALVSSAVTPGGASARSRSGGGTATPPQS